MTSPGTLPPEIDRSNGDYPWQEFDSELYFDHNYRHPREDDLRMLGLVRDFFDSMPSQRAAYAHGVDVGAGANLFPALSMLPLCHRLTLMDLAATNVDWLRKEVNSDREQFRWGEFWHHLTDRPLYRNIEDPRLDLKRKTDVQRGSVYDLPVSTYHVGTMFFVAESISARRAEFRVALNKFVLSLHKGAPFAAAFMENSSGYHVGKIRYPAVPIDASDISKTLDKIATVEDVRRVDYVSPLRDGYTGMILALGWRRR